MRLEHESEEKLKKDIVRIIGSHVPLNGHRVFFFGSRVAGTNSERSDIDVGIEGKEPIPWRVMADIEDDIENLPTLYKIEVVDFVRTAKKFREVALRHREIISP